MSDWNPHDSELPISADLQSKAPELFSVYADYAKVLKETAEQSLTLRLYALVRLGVALSIPNAELIVNARRLAQEYASEEQVAATVSAAAHLRSGAAIAYGRLVFKLLEGPEDTLSSRSSRSQIAIDREFMTMLRKASPKPFDAMARLTTTRQNNPILPSLDYELIAIAIATITQCVYCLEMHGNKARELGASNQQIADVVHIAISARYEATLYEWSATSVTQE